MYLRWSTTIVLIILLILSLIIVIRNKEYLDLTIGYKPPPMLSKYQNYDWYTISNPNIGFAPAVHLMSPSRQECLNWINDNFSNPDEAYTKFIECLQNITSKVKIKNLPIQSPGTEQE